MNKERDWNIDYLRILACFMVVFLHVSGQNWRTTDITRLEWQIFHFYDALVRSAVPLFLMISGKLFLQKETMTPLSRFYKKNVAKMIYLYFLWAFFYAIDTVGIRTILNGNAWSELIKYTLNTKIHLWYLPSLIGVYFLLPVLWSLVKYDNGKYLLYVCGMWLGFTVIKDTLLTFPLNENLEILINKFDFNLNNYCGYFLLGHVLDKYQHIFTKMKSYLLILAYIGIVIVAAAIDSYRSLLTGTPVSSLMGNFMFPVFLEACIIFLLFLRIPKLPLKDWMFAAIKNISKYTLFVYLFHIFVLEHLKINFGISALSFHPILSVPILSAGIFLICMLIAFIIDHIPYVRNMIM